MWEVKTKKVYADIKSLKIQGATNVAKAICLELVRVAWKNRNLGTKKLWSVVEMTAELLTSARITEPLSENAILFLKSEVKKYRENDSKKLALLIKSTMEFYLKMLNDNELLIADIGEKLIRKNDHVATHCHASSVMNIFAQAKNRGKKFTVFNGETRPRFQGRKSSEKLASLNIANFHLVDSAMTSLLFGLNGNSTKIDIVIVGCDEISLDGGCANKVGTLALALSARAMNIPFYIAGTLLKVDKKSRNFQKIAIEQRPAKEIWENPPKGVKILNPSFDIIPPGLISGYICELGVLEPKEVADFFFKNYSFLK